MRLRPDVAALVDDHYMRRAIELAFRGRGRTAPNPAVGAVVVRDGEIVGEGFHPRAGQPHAEVFALAGAGAAAKDATLYVTLEPCSHHGKTPPCTGAIIAAGVRDVVIGQPDPTPEARGGAHVLADAGVAVSFWPDVTAFERLNEGWLTRVRTGRPLVRAKIALSLDGHPAFVAGERAAISGAAGVRVTGAMRDAADAVLVGAATVTADDPALTARDDAGALCEHQPLRVVLVGGDVPSPDSQVFRDHAAPTLVLAADEVPDEALRALPPHVLVERYDAEAGLGGALEELGRRGLNDVLVEPGPRLLTALHEAGLIGELITVTAGGMAGAAAPSLYRGDAEREGAALVHTREPRLTTVVGDVVVTVWGPAQHTQHRS